MPPIFKMGSHRQTATQDPRIVLTAERWADAKNSPG
jgi:hypothetical protein